MEFGVVFPTSDIGTDPGDIADFARTAEMLGYQQLSTYEHVLGAPHEHRRPPLTGPYTDRTPFHEPMVLFGYLAALTSAIDLATAVLVLPQRQTALMAKQAVELALLSGGRFVLGLGTGWNYVEYEALGQRFNDRGTRLDEQIEVLRRLWHDELVDFEGDHHRLPRVSLNPRLPCPIPILFGGSAERAFERAARYGNGFIFRSRGAQLARDVGRVNHLLEEVGRADEPFRREAFIDHDDGPEAWKRQIDDWERLGGSMLSLRTFATEVDWHRSSPVGLRSPAEHLDALGSFIETVAG